MIKNYDSVDNCLMTKSTISQKQRDTSCTTTKRSLFSFIAVFVALFSFVFAQGQSSANYAFSTGVSTLNSMTGSTAIPLTAFPADDYASAVYPIGFSFIYMGNYYTHFSVNSNGQMRLHTNATATAISGSNISSYSSSTVTIAPMGGDNETGNGMSYLISGSAPNRKLIIEWNNFYANYIDPQTSGNMQLVLNESTGVIDFLYGNILNSSTSSVSLPIFHSSSNTANSSASITVGTTPTQNTTATSPTSNTFVASVQIANLANVFYKFSPSVPAAGPTSLTFAGVTASKTTLNWTAASSITGLVRYVVFNSTNGGTTYNFVANVPIGTNTYAATGLIPSTTYDWKVVAISEGVESTPATGVQATSAQGIYNWVATTGTAAWNTDVSWDPLRANPDPSDKLNFNQGGSSIVTIPASSIGGNVVFSNNTTANFQASAANTLTLASLIIDSGSTLNVNGTTAQTIAFSSPAINTISGRLEITNTTGVNVLNVANSVTTVSSTGTLASGGTVNTTAWSSTSSTTLLVNGTYEHKYTTVGGSLPTATWADGSNCNIIGYTTNTSHPTYAQSFSNFTWNCPSQTATTTGAISGSWIVRNNLNLISTGTGSFVNSGGNTYAIKNIVMSGGTFNLASSTATYTITGNFTKTGGTMTPTGACVFNFANTSIAQNLTIDALVANTATWRFSNPLGVTITGTGSFPTAFPIGNGTSGGVRISTNVASPIIFAGTISNGFAYNAASSTLTYDYTGSGSATSLEFPDTNGPASLTVSIGSGNVLSMPFSRTVRTTLNLSSGDVDVSSNTLTLGTSASTPGTNAGVGNIRVTTGGFKRWFGTTSLPTTPGSTVGFFPLASSIFNRNVSIYFSTATALSSGGTITVKHTNVPSISAVNPSFSDGTATVDTKSNSSWTFVAGDGLTASGTLGVRLTGNSAVNTSTPTNLRLVQETAALGTHVAGGGTSPNFQASRTGLSIANITAAPHFIGGSSTDILGVVNSIATGDWNAPSTWDTNTVPSCTDVVNILSGHNVTVNSVGNVSKGITINTGGTFTVASGDVKVGCTNNNNELTNNGTLTISGGTLNINGNYLGNSGSTLNQSGGDINVDGNAGGVTANSVASGKHLFTHTATAVSNLNLTAGKITIVDPHANTSSSDYSFRISQGGAYNSASANHTVRFGDGVSNDNGGNTTYGFYYYLYPGSYYYGLGNLEINAGTTGNNRWVYNGTSYLNGNINIVSGELRQVGSSIVCPGNIINNGVFTNGTNLVLGQYNGTTTVASTNAQTISGSGVFRNLTTSPTANITNLTFNNSNATGVTLSIPLSISGTLTMTSGIINTTNTNLLSLGTAAAVGIFSGTPSATNMVKGPFARTIPSGNTNSSYVLFPVGKSAYSPISIAPATTAVTIMKAEVFDSNTGTQNASIIDMSSSRRWEAPIVSGTVTDLNVRLNDTGILATSIPVQAASATGQYTNTFGSVATAIAGVSTQSNSTVTSANYTGFLSYANSNACNGTPTPGNTIPTSSIICLGNSVNLSLQNTTSGTGVTYQWKSSTDGTTYTAISGATSSTLTVSPTSPLYYVCDVSCSAGPSTGTSNAVQITFSNSIASSTGGTRCGTGTVNLSATPSSGATVKWYANETGGTSLGSGNSFTTPNISATSTYYASAETLSAGNVTLGTETSLTSATSQNSVFCNYWYQGWRQFVYTAAELQALGLGAGNITSISFNISTLPSPSTVNNFAVRLGTTTNSTLTTYQTTGLTLAYGPSNYTPVVGLNTITLSTPYSWDGVSNILIDIREDGQYASANSKTYVSTTASNTVLHSYSSTNNTSYYTSSPTPTASNTRPNVVFAGQVACQSARKAVVATVTTPPALTISSNSSTICESNSTSTVTLSSTTSNYNTYSWAPSTGVSGNESSGWTFNPSVSTNYTLTSVQTSGDFCSSTSSFAVTVNPRPSELVISPVTGSVCPGTIQSLEVTGGTLSSIANVGTGTTTNGTTSYPSPFTNYYGGTKHQMLIKASELTSMGLVANQSLVSLAFEVTAVGSTFSGTLNNFQVDLGLTTTNTLTSSFLPTTVNARSAASLSVAVGVVTIPLTGNFVWDGTSNIVIQTSFSNVNSGTATDYVQMKNSDSGFSSTNWYREDGATATVILNATTANSSGNSRPNMVLKTLIPTTISWSPIDNLFTDSAATVPYVANGDASKVYFKSSTAATATTYTATSKTGLGCIRSATVDVTVNALPTVITVAPAAVCTGSTVNLTTSEVTTGSDTGLTYTYFTNPEATTTLTSSNAVANSGTYYIKGTNSNGCSSVSSVVVTINSLPTVITVAPATVCYPNTVNLTASSVTTGSDSGLTFTYFTDLAATSSYSTPSTAVAGTYYIKGTKTNGCSAVTSVVASVNQPAAPTGNSTASFCGSANMTNLSVDGSNIKWYDAATAGNIIPTLAVVGLTNGTTYYASQTSNSCESVDRLAVTVTINSIPSAPNASSQTFCNSATVANLLPSGTSLKWYDVATNGSPLSGTTSLSTGNYYVSQTNNSCEGPRTTVSVTVNATDAPTAQAQTFCGSATVADLVATGTSIKWYSASTGGSALSSTAALSSTNYYASQTINGCEGPRIQVAVTLNSTVTPTASSQTFCSSATVADLTATGTDLKWYNASTGGTALSSSASLSTGNYYVTQTLNGCESNRLTVGVTITTVTTPTGTSPQSIFGGVAADATIEDISVNGSNVIWYPTAADAIAGTNAILAGTEITNGSTYYAVSVNGTCRSSVLEITVSVTLDKESFDVLNFKYYPNPTSDILNISYSDEITQIRVFNALGQNVLDKKVDSLTTQIDLSQFTSGTYFVEVRSNKVFKTVKVIKK